MSPQMVSVNHLRESGEETPTINYLSFSKTSSNLIDYIGEQEALANRRIIVGTNEARREMEWLISRVPVFEKLIRHFSKDEQRIAQLLRDAYINQHDFRHQQTVAGYAMALSREFGVPDEEIEAVGLAACFHDMGYTPLDKPVSQITKEDFDTHAANGAAEFEALKKHADPDIRQYFHEMDPDAFRAAYLGIYHHNGGSREYVDHKSRIPLSSKMVRAADKAADNRLMRVAPEHLHKDLRSVDKYYRFRTVTAGIFDIALVIDKDFRQLDVVHDVNRSTVFEKYGPYKRRRFQRDFNHAYAKQMFAYTDVMQDALAAPATNDEGKLAMNATFLYEDGTLGRSQFSLRGKAVKVLTYKED